MVKRLRKMPDNAAEKRSRLDEVLTTVDNLRQRMKDDKKTVDEAQDEAVKIMGSLRITEHQFANGKHKRVAKQQGGVAGDVVDWDGVLNDIPKNLRMAVTVRVIDMNKMAAFIASEEIDPEIIAAHTTKGNPSKKFVKIS